MGYAIEHLVPEMGSCFAEDIWNSSAGCACRFYTTIVNKGSLLLLEVFST
jgi:hypothetical protein